jgi:hypothetical protein
MTSVTKIVVSTLCLDRILECAVVRNWKELMPVSESGLIQIEYGTGSEHPLDYLKVWACTKSCSKLICEYWMESIGGHRNGLSFSNGYRSEELARMLSFIMQHQGAFLAFGRTSPDGTIQVYLPTEEEITAADESMAEAFASFGAVAA